jgi:hypothetical protein
VTAREAGEKWLHLAVGVRIKFEHGGEERRFYPLFDKEINVTVNVSNTISHFFQQNWQ